MKLIGNLKGGNIYPETIKNVFPTKHKYGSNLTWSAHTDTYKPTIDGHGIDAEINAFKNNLQLTILVNPTTDSSYTEEIKGALETGRISAGLYFRANISTSIQSQLNWYVNTFGKLPSYWSYGNGVRDYDEFVLSNGLVSRLSQSGEHSYDFNERLGHKVSSVFNYDVRDNGQAQALIDAETNLSNAISVEGWFNDFSHWHWANQYGDKNQLELFLKGQKELLNNVNYISLGAGEAVEYMWLRNQFKRAGIYQDGNELVIISDVRNTENIPYKAIDESLSLEVDLTDTILEGKEIEGNTDILKTDVNSYIVQIPYSIRDGFRTARLKETSEPKYIDLSVPTLTINVLTNQIEVSADKQTNAVLFKVPKNGNYYESEIVERNNTMEHSHIFDVLDSNYDYYVGAITEHKQSVLSEKINLS